MSEPLEFEINRPHSSVHLDGSHFTSTGAMDHEFKFGFQYRQADQGTQLHGFGPLDSDSGVLCWGSDQGAVIGLIGPIGFTDSGGAIVTRWSGNLDGEGNGPCGLEIVELNPSARPDIEIEDEVALGSGPTTHARDGADALFFSVGGDSAQRDALEEIFTNAEWAENLWGATSLPFGLELGPDNRVGEGTSVPPPPAEAASAPRPPIIPDDGLRVDSPLVADFRIAYSPSLGPVDLELGVDIFNVFNSDLVLQQARHADLATFGSPTEVIGPRMIRFGARITF